MPVATPTFPLPPTPAERSRGLSKRRKKELQRVADELKAQRGLSLSAELAIKNTADVFGVTLSTFRKRFGELTMCAGWESRTPEDWLAGKATQWGGVRSGEMVSADSTRIVVRVSLATKAKLEEARQKSGLSWESLLRGAAEQILSNPAALTVDKQSE